MTKSDQGARRKLAWWHWVLIALGGFILVGLLAPEPKQGGPSAGSGQAGSGVQAVPAVPSAEEITAKALRDAFDANEIAATARYKNARLAVTGRIDAIGTDILGRPMVTLDAGEYRSVVAYFDKGEMAKAAKLAKGQDLTARCTGAEVTIGILAMEDCRL